MEKTTPLFILLLLITISTNAQTFAPTGATWHYTTKSNMQDSLRWIKIEAVADTLFAGKNAKVLSFTYESSNALPCPNGVDTAFMAQHNDSLFFYEYGKWQLLVDFSASIADTFNYEIAVSNGVQTVLRTIKTRIDSVRLDNYNGSNLRSLYLRQTNTLGGYDFHNGWITEVIGHEYAPLPWVNSVCSFGSMYIYGRRCYADSNLGNIQFTPYACQTITTSVAEHKREEAKFGFFPNPNIGQLHLDLEKQLQKIELFNSVGEKLKELDVNSSSWQLPAESGLYIIRCTTLKGEVLNKKVVKR